MWVLVIGGGVLAVVVALVLWAVYLFRRGEELMADVARLTGQLGTVAQLVDQITPEPTPERLAGVRERVGAPRGSTAA